MAKSLLMLRNRSLTLRLVTPFFACLKNCKRKSGEARILVVEGKNGDVLPHQLHGHFHVTRIVDRFLHTVADAVRRRDVARAVVTEVEPVVRLDFREREDCGVLPRFALRAVIRSRRMLTATGT